MQFARAGLQAAATCSSRNVRMSEASAQTGQELRTRWLKFRCAPRDHAASLAESVTITSARLIERFSCMLGLLVISVTVSRVWERKRLSRRFIAAMIKTSSSVEPRVVIFHMTASQLFEATRPLLRQ
jgi:hypothetical protein